MIQPVTVLEHGTLLHTRRVSFSHCLGLCQPRHCNLPSPSFLQAQLLKQFLQKLAFRKDEQSFYLSCTAVLCIMWGRLRGGCGCCRYLGVESVDTQSKPRPGCLQGRKPCRETRSSIRFGEPTHIFLKLGVFSHKMELWLCAFQSQVDAGNAGCSCRVVYLCHHTLHPCKKRRGAHYALAITLCSQGPAQ